MSRRFVFVVALVFLLLLFGAVFYFMQRGYQPRTFALAVTGDTGRDVVGYVIVDGVKQRITGTLPLNLPFDGRKIEYAVGPVMPDPSKSINLVVTIDGKVWGSATAAGVQGGLDRRGVIGLFGGHSGWIGALPDADIVELNKK